MILTVLSKEYPKWRSKRTICSPTHYTLFFNPYNSIHPIPYVYYCKPLTLSLEFNLYSPYTLYLCPFNTYALHITCIPYSLYLKPGSPLYPIPYTF